MDEMTSNAYRVMLKEYPDVLSIGQLCEILKISTKTGYKLLNANKVKNMKIGRTYRIPKAHVLNYLIGY